MQTSSDPRAKSLPRPPRSAPPSAPAGKCDTIIKGVEHEVVAMTFLGDLPVIAVSSSDGCVRLWGTQHSPFSGLCAAEFANELPPGAMISAHNVAVLPAETTEREGGETDASEAVETGRRERARLCLAAGGARGAEDEAPEFVAVVPRGASPVTTMAWDDVEACLFTGDDGGHLRKWCLAGALARLDCRPLEVVSVNGRPKVQLCEGRPLGLGEARSLCAPAERIATGALVAFQWGLESAHESDVTVAVVVAEPRAILTASTDRCAKMFSLAGEPVGTLLQSSKRGSRSQDWDLPLDVGVRDARFADEVLAKTAEGGADGASLGRRGEGKARKHRSAKRGERGDKRADLSRDRVHKRVLAILAKVNNVNPLRGERVKG